MNVLRRLLAGLAPAAFALGLAGTAGAQCFPPTAATHRDRLAEVLRRPGDCPSEVLGLRSALVTAGARLETHMVGNRGFHNPGEGSFSLFERAVWDDPAELFLGHFTTPGEDGLLVLDQTPRRGALMVELFAWDPGKGLYNFYELIGDGTRGRWHYRGDSADIRADVAGLHLPRPAGAPPFGARLRCSGCHLAGGPILKELAPPHNDWWTRARRLPLGGRRPDPVLAGIMDALRDPGELADAVRLGMRRLEASPASPRRGRPLRERLRPLFAPEELNLESDSEPLGTRPFVRIPSSLVVDARLGRAELRADARHYGEALARIGSRFPEVTPARPDADHAWLSPVRAEADQIAVEALIGSGLVDEEFVLDVLAVDMGRPLFSPARTRLLALVPAEETPDWQALFRSALRRSGDPAARELLVNLEDPARDREFHRTAARARLRRCARGLGTAPGVLSTLRLLVARRREVVASEISQNPRGQILEPGFRVIFPETDDPGAEEPDCPCGP